MVTSVPVNMFVKTWVCAFGLMVLSTSFWSSSTCWRSLPACEQSGWSSPTAAAHPSANVPPAQRRERHKTPRSPHAPSGCWRYRSATWNSWRTGSQPATPAGRRANRWGEARKMCNLCTKRLSFRLFVTFHVLSWKDVQLQKRSRAPTTQNSTHKIHITFRLLCSVKTLHKCHPTVQKCSVSYHCYIWEAGTREVLKILLIAAARETHLKHPVIWCRDESVGVPCWRYWAPRKNKLQDEGTDKDPTTAKHEHKPQTVKSAVLLRPLSGGFPTNWSLAWVNTERHSDVLPEPSRRSGHTWQV